MIYVIQYKCIARSPFKGGYHTKCKLDFLGFPYNRLVDPFWVHCLLVVNDRSRGCPLTAVWFQKIALKGGFPRHILRKRLGLREVFRSVLRVIMVDLVDGFVVLDTDVYRLQRFNR
jgi:hypothetical protein